jgi:hypothetical protein
MAVERNAPGPEEPIMRARSTSRLQLLAISLALLCGGTVPAGAAEQHTWLKSLNVPRTSVDEALARLERMSPEDAKAEAGALVLERDSFSPAGRLIADFLVAAALERGNELEKAKLAYAAVLRSGAGTDFGIAADVRGKVLAISSQDIEGREAYFEALAKEPARESWFLVGGQWVWSTSARASLQELINLRANRASFRVFELLRSYSTFPAPYAYLFVLLVLGSAVKVLTLPLSMKLAIVARRVRRLQPAIQHIQRLHRDDPMEAQRQLQELYRERGLNFAPGCAVGVLDMIFVIWALVALSAYAPQLILDEARFWTVTDVTRPSGLILLLWMSLSLLQGINMAAVQGVMPVQSIFITLLSGSIFAGIAWYWEWPAYVMIFWGMLSLMGMALSLVLLPFGRLAAGE